MREKGGGRRSEPSAKRGEETGCRKRPGLEPGSQRVSLPRSPSHRLSMEAPAWNLADQGSAAFLRSGQPWAATHHTSTRWAAAQPAQTSLVLMLADTGSDTKRVSRSLGCRARAGSHRALS